MLYSIASGYIQNLANHLNITYQTELGESADTYLHDYKISNIICPSLLN